MTRIPLPFNIQVESKDFAKSIVFFVFTSLTVGGVMLGVYYLFDFLDLSFLALIMPVGAQLLITGSLHLDGLADCCDGFFSRKSKDKVLEILKDSRIGAFGVVAIVLSVIIKIALIGQLKIAYPQISLIYVFLSMPVAGKIPLIICAAISPYAREEGMGKNFIDLIKLPETLVSLILLSMPLVLFFGLKSVIIIPALLIIGVIISLRSKRKIGGVTGDVLGACNEVGELLFLTLIFILYNWQVF